MIGQKALADEIGSCLSSGFPRASALVGEAGCGKHTAARLISEKLGASLRDITGDLDSGLLFSAEQGNTDMPMTYMFDASAGSAAAMQRQNLMLKFLEEPYPNSYVIVLCSSDGDLIPAVRSRCRLFRFRQYSMQELSQFVPKDCLDASYAEQILRTPGRLMSTDYASFDGVRSMAGKILDRSPSLSLPGLLRWSDTAFSYGDGSGRPESCLFARMIQHGIVEKLANGADSWYNRLSSETAGFEAAVCHVSGISERYLVQRYLIALYRAGRGRDSAR